MEDDWKTNWNAYLKKKYGEEIPHGPIEIDLGEIDFYIPPLLAYDTKGFRTIQKHNAKKRIF
jgi:hypothetical protein